MSVVRCQSSLLRAELSPRGFILRVCVCACTCVCVYICVCMCVCVIECDQVATIILYTYSELLEEVEVKKNN